MRSVPEVWINIVLAPKHCSFPEVAVVVEHFFPLSNFLATSTHGIEMGSCYLLGAWDLYTCSVMKPLMRPLLSYSGFWLNMKSHYPEFNEWHLFPTPFWSLHSSCSTLWKRCATQRENQCPESKVAFPSPDRDSSHWLFNILALFRSLSSKN